MFLAATLDPTALECHKYKPFPRAYDGSITAHTTNAPLLQLHSLMVSYHLFFFPFFPRYIDREIENWVIILKSNV